MMWLLIAAMAFTVGCMVGGCVKKDVIAKIEAEEFNRGIEVGKELGRAEVLYGCMKPQKEDHR